MGEARSLLQESLISPRFTGLDHCEIHSRSTFQQIRNVYRRQDGCAVEVDSITFKVERKQQIMSASTTRMMNNSNCRRIIFSLTATPIFDTIREPYKTLGVMEAFCDRCAEKELSFVVGSTAIFDVQKWLYELCEHHQIMPEESADTQRFFV